MILATSPFLDCGEGSASRRVVLREFEFQFVVHWQLAYSDGKTCFTEGEYFLYEPYDETSRQLEFEAAYRAFNQRVNRDMDVYGVADMTSDPVRFKDFLSAKDRTE